jgi:hypothetical protein
VRDNFMEDEKIGKISRKTVCARERERERHENGWI